MQTVIVGAGFAGIRAMQILAKDKNQQVILIDRHDYNFFPPLIYQVAAGFLSPSDISYPLRKFVANRNNVSYRQGTLQSIDTEKNTIYLDNGRVAYDRLVMAIGSEANFFGNQAIEKHALPMKRLSDALAIRNRLLQQFNYAATLPKDERAPYLNVVIAGGGPSGVELAGVLSEIRHDIFAKEYPEFIGQEGGIELITADPELLMPMRQTSQQYAKQKLIGYGVKLTFSDPVADYDGTTVSLASGKTIKAKTVIWTAGVQCKRIEGLTDSDYGRGNRLLVNENLRLCHYNNIYALGDIAICWHDKNYPQGHPQLGQVAMMQGVYLGQYLREKTQQPFVYRHRGDMAMIGRLKAVSDLKKFSLHGLTAWVAWVVIHIIALNTAKNRIATTYDWMISFFTRNQSLRMDITARSAEEKNVFCPPQSIMNESDK